MPTIVMASSKGGAGKTTAAVTLAGELARQGLEKGVNIALVDADPNKHSAKWAKKNGCPENLTLYESDESSIIDDIEKAEQENAFVIVDLEGTASIAVANAVSRADLVIILCQGSQNDADEAVKTIKLLRQQGKAFRRDIPYSVLFTRTSTAIVPRTLKFIVSQFTDSGVDVFKVSLIEKDAYKAVHSFGGIVNNLDPKDVSGIEVTAANAKAYAEEVKRKLKEIMSGGSDG
tara:strand:- start:2669 stop:3364 length:696 start_codon:yes stop_codon:yes gene_type:complete